MRKPMCQWLYTFSSVTMFNYRRISSIFASFSSIPMEMNICPTEFLQDWSLSEKTPLSHPIPAKTMWTCATGLSIWVRKRNVDLGWTWHHFAYWTGFPSMRSCPCSCRERRDASTVSQEMASNPEVLGIPIAGDPNLSGIICLIINNGIVMAHLRCFFFLSGEIKIITTEKSPFPLPWHLLDRLAAVMQPFALTQ